MQYEEYGLHHNNTILFLHGGGLASWNYIEEVKQLQDRYHIVIPVLDGHSGSDQKFTSIEDNANRILEYIDKNCSGKVFMICGLSLGGQILVEMLSKRNDICKYAIIESALVLPMKTTFALIEPTFSMCYPLIRQKWFAKAQFRSLHIQKSFFDNYYRDSVAITKENMIAFLKANSNYELKEGIRGCQAKVLVAVGSRESRIMQKSARLLHEMIPHSRLETLSGYYHGELSLNHPKQYVQKMDELISD